ncbi:TrwH protein [Bartonella machadoae]|nr:TrwH protein [Bartonella machadoae]UNE55603.1 TrwH protein [Bartonella machadoae]
MKQIIFVVLIVSLLSACGLAPKPKQPSQWNRIPINKTVLDEIQRGAI